MYVEDLLRSLVARDHLEYTWAWVWAVLRCFQRPYRAYFFSSMNSQQSIRIHLHNLGKSKLQDKQGEGRPKAVHAGASGHGEPQFRRPWKEPKSPQRDKDPCFYSRNAPPQKKKANGCYPVCSNRQKQSCFPDKVEDTGITAKVSNM